MMLQENLNAKNVSNFESISKTKISGFYFPDSKISYFESFLSLMSSKTSFFVFQKMTQNRISWGEKLKFMVLFYQKKK